MRKMRRGLFDIDFVGRAKTWFIIAGVLVLLSIGSLGLRQLNLGLEFRGGTSFEVQGTKDVPLSDLRELVEDAGVASATVQGVGARGYLIQTEHVGADVQQELARVIASRVGADVREVTVNDVGAKWGQQVSDKAIRALLIFLAVTAAYISLRFEPKMAVTALVALFHDLVITAGIYSMAGFVVTPATVIALLTILGYSLYDTVIMFDRVKEETRMASAGGRRTYSQIANHSLNTVLTRSISTTITSLLPVGSLLFVGSYLLGATTLRELALALFIGMGAGTFSSIFIAVPLLAIWKEREQKWTTLRARIAARSAEPTGARVRSTATPAPDAAEDTSVATRLTPGYRPPKRAKGKRKRR
jgi:preprotein translocase subunit SecF